MEKQKEIETKNFQPWKIFAIEALLFSLTLGLGIAAAVRMNEIYEIQKFEMFNFSFWKFTAAFFTITLFIFLLVRFFKFKKGKSAILKIIFIFAVTFGGMLFLEIWLSQPFPLIIISVLIFWWWKKPLILNQNILIILGIAGIGSSFGATLQPLTVMILLIVFSIYDYIAVYKTKHMVKIAKEMIENRAIMALAIPSDISGFKASLEEIKPGGEFLILGGGDIVFPLLFCSSLIPTGILNSIIVAFFSLIGLFIGFFLFIRQKVRAPIPALPLIAFFSIIGYFLIKWIF